MSKRIHSSRIVMILILVSCASPVWSAENNVYDATGQIIGELLDFGTLNEIEQTRFVKVMTAAGHVMRLNYMENSAQDSEIFPFLSLPIYYDNPGCTGAEYSFIGTDFDQTGDPWGGIVGIDQFEPSGPRYLAMPAIGFEPPPGAVATYYANEGEMCGEAGEFDNLHDISPYLVTSESLGLTTPTGFQMPFELRREDGAAPTAPLFCSGFEHCPE